MKRFGILILSLLALMPVGKVLAQETINAGLLPVVWYSDTAIYAGDEIKIYGGMQNHSTSTISAQVVFQVDGEPVSTAKFTSKPDTLIELEGKWNATSGNHKVSLRITSSEPSNLLSTASEEVSLSVKTRITTAKVKEVASETADNIVSTIDAAAETLSDKILALKKPTVLEPLTQDTSSSTQTLSGHPEGGSDQSTASDGVTRSAYNLALTFLAASVLRWKITLAALILLILVVKFTS